MNRAIEIWTSLAEAGDVDAQHNLGLTFYHGYAGTVDYREAARWFSMSATQGFPASLFLIGAMYYHGEGIEQDLEMARGLIQDAADQGDPQAIQALREWF